MTEPKHCAIAPLEALGGVPVEDVTVEDVTVAARDGVEVRGWLARRSDERLAVVFAGIGGNRRTLLGLGQHDLERGWSILLPDLRGTGESGGDRIGLGYLERLDVHAWIDFARARGFADVGLHGHSLGAAAITYAIAETGGDGVAFVVLDSCYDDVGNALANRLPWVPVPAITFLPVDWFGRAKLGASRGALRPLACLESLRMPLLLVASDADSVVRPAESEALFAVSPAENKKLVWIPCTEHTILWRHAPQLYASALDEFLAGLAPTSTPRSRPR